MEELIELIKDFNNIKNDNYDGKIKIWIRLAVKAIFNYLNNDRLTDEKIMSRYPEAILMMVSKAYASALEAAASGDSTGTGIGGSTSHGTGGIKKIVQGQRTIEYYQETETTSTSSGNKTTVNSKDLDPFDIDNNAQLKRLLPRPFIKLRY